ncbi:MAG: DNA-binding protein WhiA [Bacillota bacterium]|nr:DNA-binding protein WhiA [Bacillota bacterium]
MTRGEQSFSQRIKDELSKIPCLDSCCRQVELATAYWAAGKSGPQQIDLSTGHAGFSSRIATLLSEQYGLASDIRSGREFMTIHLTEPGIAQRIHRDIQTVFIDNSPGDISKWSMCCKQALLRSLFLACGSVSEPSSAYHMELAIRRENNSAETLKALLDQMDLHSTLVMRNRYAVIYLREGQFLADYLLMAGAHQSLLTFESLRVEKEMRNSVNRVVNCDSANLQRVADAAARQSELLRTLQSCGLDNLLPLDLKAAAEIRLENPDLTLKELGALINPPLGKSGMNHRLKRFEQLAAELLSREEI